MRKIIKFASGKIDLENASNAATEILLENAIHSQSVIGLNVFSQLDELIKIINHRAASKPFQTFELYVSC